MEYTSDWEFSPETMEQMIEKRVMDILRDVDDTLEFGMDDDLQNVGFDSLDKLEISMEIEKQFGIYISDGELYEYRSRYTPRDIIEYVKDKLRKQQPKTY